MKSKPSLVQLLIQRIDADSMLRVLRFDKKQHVVLIILADAKIVQGATRSLLAGS